MENKKLFEFMEKLYSELQTTRTEMQQSFNNVNTKIDIIENRMDGLGGEVKKNSIKLEDIEKKVYTIAEVQQNHIKQNENNHIEIVEILTDKIDLTQSAMKNLNRVK